MKPHFLMLLPLLLGATANVEAQTSNVITVAVFNFDSPVKSLRGKINSLVTADLSGDPRFVLVERAQLKKALTEQALGLSGNIDFNAAAKVGQLTGAKVLVAGRAFKASGELVIAANIISTETSRAFSETVRGSETNLITLAATLSEKIKQTINARAADFIADATSSRNRLIEEFLGKIAGTNRPAVLLQINERVPQSKGVHQTAANELGLILQKAGFPVVDRNSARRPVVMITGTAAAVATKKSQNMFSCRATLEIKATERETGKILTFDRQESVAVDIGKQVAARQALQNAADGLAERLLPLLAE